MTIWPALLFLAGLLFSVGQIVLAFCAFRRRARLRQSVTAERIRGRFGRARNALLRAAIDGYVDPRSITFRMLYLLNTEGMRQQDRYKQMSDRLLTILTKKENRSYPEMVREAVAWNDEVIQVTHLTMLAVEDLLIEYLPFSRLIRFVRVSRAVKLAKACRKPIAKVWERFSSTRPPIDALFKTRIMLRSLAG